MGQSCTSSPTECEASGLPSQLICSARNKALEAAISAKERIKKGKRASCPQSKNARIRYDARSATIKLKEGTVTLATKKKRQSFTFHVPEYAKERTDFKVCSSDLVENKKGKYYLHVVLEHPTPDVIETNQVVGVDLGVVRPAVTSEARFLGQRRWREVQNRTFRLRRELQAKGTRSAKRKLKKVSKRCTPRLERFPQRLRPRLIQTHRPLCPGWFYVGARREAKRPSEGCTAGASTGSWCSCPTNASWQA